MFSAPTFAEVTRESRAPTTGFDYLRVGLAAGVVVIHCAWLSDATVWHWMWQSWCGPLERAVLPAFFALSGYLVSGSLLRNTLPQFAALRIARIVPALGVEVALTAVVLGGIFTTLPASDYYRAPGFWSYFLNVVGLIHYTLPGVFDEKSLNVQLWTIPFEFECYALIVVLFLLGFIRQRRLLLAATVAAVAVVTAVSVATSAYRENWNVPGRMLVISFVAGVLVYLYRDALPHSRAVAALSGLAAYLCLGTPDLVFLAALPVGYLTVYLGLLRPKPIPFGDLSYGLYLFHFPVARTLREVAGPALGWLPLLALTLVLTTLFAACSWHFVEKPVLTRKQDVLRCADRIAALFRRTVTRPLRHRA